LSKFGCQGLRAALSAAVHHNRSSIGLFLNFGESFVDVTPLEIRPKNRDRNVDGRAHRSDLNLYHGFPELLDGASAHGAPIAYESGRLAIPLRVNPVDRILE